MPWAIVRLYKPSQETVKKPGGHLFYPSNNSACTLQLGQVGEMNHSDLGMMIILLIGVFGLATFIFEKLGAHYSKRTKDRR